MRVYIFYGIVSTENRAENPTEIDSAREKDEEELPNGRIADGERTRKGRTAGGGGSGGSGGGDDDGRDGRG